MSNTLEEKKMAAKKYKEEVAEVGEEVPKEGEAITEVVEYVPVSKEEEIAKILENYKQYHSEALLGYVYNDELAKVAGMTVSVQGETVSLQSILYSGRKAVDRPKSKVKMFGPYTEAQVLNNVRLMQMYMPSKYNEYIFDTMSNNDANNSKLTGCCLGGRQRFRR